MRSTGSWRERYSLPCVATAVRQVMGVPAFYYLCLSGIVILGLTVGMELRWVGLSPPHLAKAPVEILNVVSQWDGQWYLRIIEQGYTYNPDHASNVAFFPMFPLLGRGVALITALSSHMSVWAVAQACLIGSLGLFWLYLRAYRTRFQAGQRQPAAHLAMAALVLYPPCLFMWMAYSESLFLLLSLVLN